MTAGDTSLTISPTTGAVVASLNLGNANTWTALQQFSQASSTRQSIVDRLYLGGTATTTIVGDSATSTFSGGLTLTAGHVNLASGSVYLINNAAVLTGTALGAAVTGSSLTSVGALTAGSIGGSFGAINIGSNALTAGAGSVTSLTNSGTLSVTGLAALSGQASTTRLSVFDTLYIGANATTTLQGETTGTSTIRGFLTVSGSNSTSTFSGNLVAATTSLTQLTLTGGATSTAGQGWNLTSGCFAINGVCVGGGGGGVSLSAANTWTALQTFSAGTLSTASSTFSANLHVAGVFNASSTLLFDSNRVSFLNSATTTVKDNVLFAWTIATTTTGSPLFQIDTTSGSERVTVGSVYTSDVIIGAVGTTTNLVFEESSTIHGQGVNTLTFGTTGDKINFAVNTGFGTSSPYNKLSVDGSVAIANLSQTEGTFHSLCLNPTTFNVIQDNDDTCSSSSARYKHDITGLNINGLAIVNSLKPSSYVYNDESFKQEVYWGFIAEDMAATDLQFGTNLTDFDQQGRPQDYYQRAVLAVTVAAIQELNLNLTAIASTTASSTPRSQAFATSFFNNLFARVTSWLADMGNGLKEIFADTFRAKEKICVDDECLTKDDIRSLLELARQGGSASPVSTPTPDPTLEPSPEPVPEPSPDPQPEEEAPATEEEVTEPELEPEPPTPEPEPELMPEPEPLIELPPAPSPPEPTPTDQP